MKLYHSVYLFLSHVVLQAIAQGGGLVIVTNPPVANNPGIVIVNPGNCQCTAPANCADGTINPRIVTNPNPIACAAGQIYCCNLINPNPTTAPPATTVAPATCGIRPTIANSFVVGPGQASYAEYPWTALIYRVADGALIGTGVLLDATTVLTAAHKVTPGTQAIRVRLGEYIINAATEPNPVLEVAVSVTRIHAQFNAVNLVNDIAILKLAASINFATTPHVRAVCLPGAGSVFTGQRCWVAGFGSNSFQSNQYQTTMREVDVPILDGPTCQARFAASRLGANFVFNQQSFICAGGEAGRDACTGDGGAGLVCLVGTQWVVAGLVAWGLECGLTNVPGAYVNIPNYLGWIAQNRG